MEVNKFPRWKNWLVIITTLLGFIYSLPNFFGEDYAVQVNDIKGQEISESFNERIVNLLEKSNIAYKSIENQKNGELIRVQDSEDQLKTKDLLEKNLGNNYVVALNLAPSYPHWLNYFHAKPMKLGLDLRGGVHFLMQVDTNAVIKRRLETYVTQIKEDFSKDNINYSDISINSEDKLKLQFNNLSSAEKGRELLLKKIPDLIYSKANNNSLIANLPEAIQKNITDYAIEQSLTTMRKRVNELGVAEAAVARQGVNYIVVELPGIQDTARAKDIIGKTASLEFRLSMPNIYPVGSSPKPPIGYTAFKNQDDTLVYFARNSVILTGDSITMATAGVDQQSGTPAVFITLGGNAQAINKFIRATRDNVGKTMATIYVESKVEDKVVGGKQEQVTKVSKNLINNATINSALGTSFQVTGIRSMEEARNLSLLLRAGALPAPIHIVSERTVGPSLGKENIKMGTDSVVWGTVLIFVFMALYYNIFGIIADIALFMNLFLLLAACSLIGVTMTLPGIAGIVLTLGMAVDANVLIFERIREEIRSGAGVQAAIQAGFGKAWVTIVDANVTTLIVAVVLFSMGSGPIKGFAVTLTIGLLISMYTAVTGSRAIINYLYGGKKLPKLPIGI